MYQTKYPNQIKTINCLTQNLLPVSKVPGVFVEDTTLHEAMPRRLSTSFLAP